MKNSSTLSFAIVAAGGLIGLGLFLGLKKQASDAPAPPVAPIGVTVPSTATPIASTVPPLDPAAPEYVALQEKVARVVTGELERSRPGLVAACWRPSEQKEREPGKLALQLRYIFDAKGERTQFGAGGNVPESRKDVLRCIEELKPVTRIAPPGAQVGVQVPFDLP